MYKKLFIIMAASALIMVVSMPASAGPAAEVEKLRGFYTSALQDYDENGDISFNWVYCRQATRVVRPDGSIFESYQCELTEWIAPPDTPPGMGPDLGPIVYPDSARRFMDESGAFYFSDFLFLTTGQICLADTWWEQLSPSGKVTMQAEYSPGACDLP